MKLSTSILFTDLETTWGRIDYEIYNRCSSSFYPHFSTWANKSSFIDFCMFFVLFDNILHIHVTSVYRDLWNLLILFCVHIYGQSLMFVITGLQSCNLQSLSVVQWSMTLMVITWYVGCNRYYLKSFDNIQKYLYYSRNRFIRSDAFAQSRVQRKHT